MKKTLLGIGLICFAVWLALFAGAGEALADLVRGVRGESEFLSIKMNEVKDITEPDDNLPENVPIEKEAKVVLVAVTPEPEAENGDNSGEMMEQPTVLTAAISSDTVVRNDTGYEIDLHALAEEGLELSLKKGEPQILIIHTHSSEAYTQDSIDRYEESDPYRTEDRRYNVVRVGDELAAGLEKYGLNVVHDREIYDYPSYTGSYTRSGEAVERYLKKYPSIKIVIDLHRDALGSGDVIYKTEAEISGQSCSQLMLLVGTGENGLSHPNWRENLKLALYMQSAMDKYCPTLARPVALKPERYNQHLSTGSLILEVGSTGNTLDESLRAIRLFASSVGPELEKLIAE